MNRLHDWILLSILYDWKEARVTLSLQWRSEDALLLVAEGVSDLHVPKLNGWGPSVSINEARGPSDGEDGKRTLEIEMQTGDVISIRADTFTFPPEAMPL